MNKIKNIGYIYKITNLVNGKIYIGQTSQTIEKRWKEHLRDVNRKGSVVHNAMRKYGIENFKIEEIEQCELENLNDREIYWISFYDSYNNGYNLTLGGGGFKIYNLNEEEVIKKYKELKRISNTSAFFGCSNNVIQLILLKHNIEIKSAVDIAKEKGFITYVLNEDKTIFKEFSSLYEAGKWVFENLKHNAKDAHSCKKSIIRAILMDNKAYGYYWYCDYYSNDYISDYKKRVEEMNKKYSLKTNNNLENQIKSLKERKDLKKYKREQKVKTYKILKKSKKELCPICNKNMKMINSICCSECNNLQSSKKFKEEFESKISKETLMDLVKEKSFIEIGNLYDVSDNLIRKWCKKYLIPFRKEDINKISNEDWPIECNLSKEEYELKYCQVKEKIELSRTEVINVYKKIKSIKGTAKEFGVGEDRIKKILVDNNIEIFNSNKVISESLGKVHRCDKETGEILETYNSMIEATDWLEKNNTTSAKRETLKKAISKAINSIHTAYGYKWKRD